MARRGKELEHAAHRGRQTAQSSEVRLVLAELGAVRQFLVKEQIGDLLELAHRGDLEDVVAAVVQVVAAAAHRAQRRVTGDHAREGDGLLRSGSAHLAHVFSFPKSSSSFFSYSRSEE